MAMTNPADGAVFPFPHDSEDPQLVALEARLAALEARFNLVTECLRAAVTDGRTASN